MAVTPLAVQQHFTTAVPLKRQLYSLFLRLINFICRFIVGYMDTNMHILMVDKVQSGPFNLIPHPSP